MSGGAFDYKQYQLDEMGDVLEHWITTNTERLDEGSGYKPATIAEFKTALLLVRAARVYLQRVDWLVSGDDGEETFHNRLLEELNELSK